MPQAPSASDTLELDASALATVWLDPLRSTDAAANEAAAIVAAAEARGEAGTALLSQAFHAVHLWVFRYNDPAAAAQVDALLAAVRRAGWPRATQLAEAAWAHFEFYAKGRSAAAAEVLRTHGEPDDDDRPAVERVWTAIARVLGASADADYDRALVCGLQAERLAEASGHDIAIAHAAQMLAYVFLSVGDVEGARAVLPAGIAARERSGRRSTAMRYNLLLAMVAGGRWDEALQAIDADPGLVQTSVTDDAPWLRVLLACALAAGGRHDEAEALLAVPRSGTATESAPVLANRVWLEGAALLSLGRPADARRVVEAGLQALAQPGTALSPMNSTHLHRVLSEACEALGDLRASLDALKRSQAQCFSWVGDSVRSRLQAMHALGGEASPPAAHAQRLDALSEAVARAQRDSEAELTARRILNLANVSHEMRNPLNGVMGLTSLLMMSDLDERQRRYLELTQTSAQMLMSLCNDVLDLAKIEAGKFELVPRPVDVAALVADTAQTFAPQAQAKSIALHWRVAPTLPPALLCDRLRLQQVLMNLLSNATKFTSRGQIDLDATWRPLAGAGPAQRGELRVTVQDTGPGITPTGHTRLFKEFSQADASVAQTHGGTGLGLALCRCLVDLMGGTIAADSTPGSGATFWFTLPLQAAPVELAPPVERGSLAASARTQG